MKARLRLEPLKEIAMVRRGLIVSLLVVGLASVAGDAGAHFQMPATAGTAGNPLRLGAGYWNWTGDGYVRRTGSLAGAALEWIIPIQFHADVPITGNNWSVQVMTSFNVTCSLQWRPNDLPTPVLEGTVPVTQMVPEGGPLDLTAVGLCPTTGGAIDCVTWYSTAFVSCLLPGGTYVGAVTYTINTHVPPPPAVAEP